MIGDKETPSIVYFSKDNKVLVGEETIFQNIEEDDKNKIYAVKSFIGLSYNDFKQRNISKNYNLNYDIVNIDNVPKIKININNINYYYTAEEISTLIIKRLIQNAESYISKPDKEIKITKAVLTVPSYFDDNQSSSIKKAANSAGIEEVRIINESESAVLAYGIKNQTESSDNIITFNLDNKSLELNLLKVRNTGNNVGCDILATEGDLHLGGNDFTKKLINFCIKEFCKETGHKEEEIRQSKRAFKRLKEACENVKRRFNIEEKVYIDLTEFYEESDLNLTINIKIFEDLCIDLYKQIEEKIYSLIKGYGINIDKIKYIILIGEATKMLGIQNLLEKIFGKGKIKNNINPEEVVAFGAGLDGLDNFINQKIDLSKIKSLTAFNLGIQGINNQMIVIIKRFSKIPCSKTKRFKIKLSEKNHELIINVFEGNNSIIKDNRLLQKIVLDKINKIGEVICNVTFRVDKNYNLTLNINIDSLGFEVEKKIGNISFALCDEGGKIIKISNYKK